MSTEPEPTKESVARQFAGWHLWVGVCGLKYARRRKASPAVVVRGETWADVAERIRAELTGRQP